jgi:hypothetical protein
MMRYVLEQTIDLVTHRIKPSTPEWYWHRNGQAVFENPWQSLLCLMVLSNRAVKALLGARRELAQRFARGELAQWPFCESFVPSIVTMIPDARLARLEDFASTENLNFRPRISIQDPRANLPGSLAHSVLGRDKFVSKVLAENRPREFFRESSAMYRGLRSEPFETIVHRLREPFLKDRDHAGLVKLDEELVARGLQLPSPAAADLALHKPALISSVSRWSHFPDPARDACGANGVELPDDYGFHTKNEANPWWMVDLLTSCLIERISILNRREASDRFQTFSIQSSQGGASWVTRFAKIDLEPVSSDTNAPWAITFSEPFAARYVRILLLEKNFLHLRRVQIFGRRTT